MKHAWLAAPLLLAALTTGCVTRRYVITSDPPGAIVYRNGQPIGATPVEEQFVYYGKYNFRLVKDGYEPVDVAASIDPPWYEYPGLDFVFENFYLLKLSDVHRLHYELKPLQTVRHDDVRRQADVLRARGKQIVPKPAAPNPLGPAPAGGAPRVLPPGTPVAPATPGSAVPPAGPTPPPGVEPPPPDAPPSRAPDDGLGGGVRGGAPLGPAPAINPPPSR
jgi:hypothetical protein